MSTQKCFVHPPPGLNLKELSGVLIVIEGPDSSGRSTQVAMLTRWLEAQGFPVAQVGLRRSYLVAKELESAKQGNTLSPRTMSLFYATDFYDQMENVIVPALRAGSVVLADRYIFTLMARDLVRGAEAGWLESLYGLALVPDAVFYLDVSIKNLANRGLRTQGSLNYWESGMDMGLTRDWFESFTRYQTRLRKVYLNLGEHYGFARINGNRMPDAIQKELKVGVQEVLRRRYPGIEVHEKPLLQPAEPPRPIVPIIKPEE